VPLLSYRLGPEINVVDNAKSFIARLCISGMALAGILADIVDINRILLMPRLAALAPDRQGPSTRDASAQTASHLAS
jgi:hypothetical protein